MIKSSFDICTAATNTSSCPRCGSHFTTIDGDGTGTVVDTFTPFVTTSDGSLIAESWLCCQFTCATALSPNDKATVFRYVDTCRGSKSLAVSKDEVDCAADNDTITEDNILIHYIPSTSERLVAAGEFIGPMSLSYTILVDVAGIEEENRTDGHVLIRHGERSAGFRLCGDSTCRGRVCVNDVVGRRIGSECEINLFAVGGINICTNHDAIVGAIDLNAADVILCRWCRADGEAGDIRAGSDSMSLLTLVGGHVRHGDIVAVRDIRST